MEHLLNLVIVPTSGTCGTAVLTTPLKVVEACVVSLGTVARTPQSYERVLVVLCIGAS